MNYLNQANRPIYVEPTMHKFASWVVKIVCVSGGLAILAAVMLRADHLTTRERAKTAKQEAQVAVDRTPNFGRVITDASGNVISWNRGMSETTGYRADETIGKPIANFIAPSAMDSPVAKALLAGGHEEGNLLLRRAGTKNGTVLVKASINTASNFRYVVANPVGQLTGL